MNGDQKQETSEFKTYVAGVFSRAAADYDHISPGFLTYFGRKLVYYARLSAADSVLDVAGGRGVALFFLPNLSRALAETKRVLKPGGQMTASTFLEVQGGLEKR